MVASKLIVTVVLLCAVVAQRGQAAECEGNSSTTISYECTSCTHALLCTPDSSQPLYETDCEAGTACQYGAIECLPVDTLPFEHCGCDADGSYVDPYEESGNVYVLCKNGEAQYITCEEGYTLDATSEECVEKPDCNGQLGNYPIGTSCTDYLSCGVGTTTEETCADSTEIFDFDSQGCVSEFTCITDGQFADPLKCNIFHVCLGGVDYVHCCPYNMNYNENTGLCAAGAPCSRVNMNDCVEAQYENDYCNYCSVLSEGDTYSTFLASECQTVYYECVLGDDGLQAELRDCDEGTVFSQDSGLCEFIAAHPECT